MAIADYSDKEIFGMRLALEDSLRLQGYEVAAVGSGEEALQLLRSQHFDLLLTDQAMPGLTGLQLTVAVKKIRPELPVMTLPDS